MNIPKKIFLSKSEAVEARFVLPSGKVVTLVQGTSYLTDDIEELGFFSQQKAIGITDIDDKEFRDYITMRENELPTLINSSINKVDFKNFKWNTEDEQFVVDKLKSLGYMVYKIKPNKKDKE